jgi:hypothetical protein
VFDRNSEMLGGSIKHKDKARKLITQIINALTAKLEIGGPMASLYLLGNPDHYTSHKFIPVYWKNYVHEVIKSWTETSDSDVLEKVVLYNQKGKFVGLLFVHDYVYRPTHYENVNLYKWVQCAKRVKIHIQPIHDEVDSHDKLDMIEPTIQENSSYKPILKTLSTLNNLEYEVDELNITDHNNL